MKLDVFGRTTIEVLRENDHWVCYILGEGKKRRDYDLSFPPELSEAEVVVYIADLFHEGATPENPDVRRIE